MQGMYGKGNWRSEDQEIRMSACKISIAFRLDRGAVLAFFLFLSPIFSFASVAGHKLPVYVAVGGAVSPILGRETVIRTE